MLQNFLHPAAWRLHSSERSVWINESATNEGYLRELESEAASIHGLLLWHLLFSMTRWYLCGFSASHLYFNEFLFTMTCHIDQCACASYDRETVNRILCWSQCETWQANLCGLCSRFWSYIYILEALYEPTGNRCHKGDVHFMRPQRARVRPSQWAMSERVSVSLIFLAWAKCLIFILWLHEEWIEGLQRLFISEDDQRNLTNGRAVWFSWD